LESRRLADGLQKCRNLFGGRYIRHDEYILSASNLRAKCRMSRDCTHVVNRYGS
jgi:hypothetical protein